jgi:hypothetical protein
MGSCGLPPEEQMAPNIMMVMLGMEMKMHGSFCFVSTCHVMLQFFFCLRSVCLGDICAKQRQN